MGTAAIVLAAGNGSRLRGTENKVFATVGGRTVLAWSVRAFAACDAIDELMVVTRAGERGRVAAIIADEQLSLPVRTATGGQTRSDSELAGLEALATDIAGGLVDVVLIHDAARPFVSPPLIAEIATTARTVGGAVPTLPLEHGVYRLTADGRIVDESSERGDLHRAQTPQGFRAPELLAAYRRAIRDDFHGVDTAETVERYTDLAVAVVLGEPTNIKITYAEDLETAKQIAAARQA